MVQTSSLEAYLETQVLNIKKAVDKGFENVVTSGVTLKTEKALTDVKISKDEIDFYTDLKELARLSNLSEEQVWMAASLGRITVSKLGPLEGTTYKNCTIYVRAEPTEQLQDLVLKIIQLKSEVVINQRVSNSLEGRSVVLDPKIGLIGYLSPQGDVLLKEYAKELGSGRYKEVSGGIDTRGEELAISLVVPQFVIKDAVHTDYGFMMKLDNQQVSVSGTEKYIAPEVRETKIPNPSNDLFAMGRILGELLVLHERFFWNKMDKPAENAGVYEKIFYELKCLHNDLNLPAKGYEKPDKTYRPNAEELVARLQSLWRLIPAADRAMYE